jgi:hypothetical protein
MGSKKACLIQEGTIYGVNKDLSGPRSYVAWGQRGLVRHKKERYMGSGRNLCYKKAPYMVSVRTCRIQEFTLYGVKDGLSDTRRHVICAQ